MSPILDFNKMGGLVPVIVQDYYSREVLMHAYVNREAFDLILSEKVMYYWSRSRQSLWKKGETSGNIQIVRELRVDCDNDTLLALIEQRGSGACHTGARSCFYRVYRDGELINSESGLPE